MRRYHKRSWVLPVLSLVFFALVAVWVIRGVSDASETSRREGLRLAEQAVRRATVECYALEGAYPASYADLKERSGLLVDEDEYVVFYEIFASNIMPEITVIERGEMP